MTKQSVGDRTVNQTNNFVKTIPLKAAARCDNRD